MIARFDAPENSVDRFALIVSFGHRKSRRFYPR
jgi:hypothetical protein